ncbi:hypothetical protein MMC30_004678 [Trapelia coarctata]|nr:hypothetical protein [Trapelia coarctata]
MTGIGPVLARLGLAQYTAAFLEEGFDTWETVLDITESDLDVLNVKLGHRRRLQREIANTRGVPIGQLVPSPTLLTSIEGSRFEGLEEASGASKSSSKQEKISGGSEKRKYRRHPKPDENAPERPPSAYVIFSNKIREELKPQSLSFTDIAKRVGERWQILAPEEKEPYESRAGSLKEKYSAELTKYKRTHEYREYVQYLADFKARNAASTSETKRPKLDAHNSTGSSASGDSRHESRHGNSTPVVGLRRPRLDSSGTSPAGNMIAPLVLSTKAASPVSLSPVAFSPYTDSSSSRGMGGTSKYSGEESPIYPEAAGISQLPRISPLDDRGIGSNPTLPPLVTDVSVPRVPSIASMHPRRSSHVPPSFLRNDTRSSISSSRSSNLSSGGTAASSVFTPATPDDSRSQRALPPPASLAGSSGSFAMGAEQNHSHAFLPALSQPHQPHQPPYHHTSSSSNDYISAPSSGRSMATNDLIQNSSAFYEADVPQSSRNGVTDRHGIYPDVPQERRSLMNLSLTGSPKDFRSNPRSRAFELRDAEYPSDRRPPSLQSPMHPPAYDRPPSTSSQDPRGFGYRDDDSTDSPQPSRMDGLSVLALAGRMVDRDARKPP